MSSSTPFLSASCSIFVVTIIHVTAASSVALLPLINAAFQPKAFIRRAERMYAISVPPAMVVARAVQAFCRRAVLTRSETILQIGAQSRDWESPLRLQRIIITQRGGPSEMPKFSSDEQVRPAKTKYRGLMRSPSMPLKNCPQP